MINFTCGDRVESRGVCVYINNDIVVFRRMQRHAFGLVYDIVDYRENEMGRQHETLYTRSDAIRRIGWMFE